MKKAVALVAGIVVTATLGWVLVARSAGPAKILNLAAPAFSPRDYSTHNNNGFSFCKNELGDPVFVPLAQGGEVRGDHDNAKGSFFHTAVLPQGMQVTKLRLVVNDGDAEADVAAYLLRRKITDGTSNTAGYKVMGRAKSDGAVTNTLRAFTDATILSGRVDNREFQYFVELIDCGVPEPYSVRVFYEKP